MTTLKLLSKILGCIEQLRKGWTMLSPMSLYINRLAFNARCFCENQLGIKNNQRSLTVEELEKIIDLFGGKLAKKSDSGFRANYIKNENGFTIECGIDCPVKDIVHELGHAFLDEDQKVNEPLSCDGEGLFEIYASSFSRAFIMPDKVFRKDVTENSFQGECDIERLLELYRNVTYSDIVERGRGLGLWR